MKIVGCQTPNEAVDLIVTNLKKLEVSRPLRTFLPTGKTPKLLYSKLAQEKALWRSKLFYLQIDEFRSQRSIFLNEIKKELLDPLGLNQIATINSNWSNVEFARHIDNVLSEGIDVAVLGIGPNGHIGFHEPGSLDETFIGGEVEISNETRDRVAGADTNKAFTFGAAAFLKARVIMMLVLGSEKKEIFQRFVSLPPTSTLPATLLKSHPNFLVVTDQK